MDTALQIYVLTFGLFTGVMIYFLRRIAIALETANALLRDALERNDI